MDHSQIECHLRLPILLGRVGGGKTVIIASANDPNPTVVDATGIFDFQGTTSTRDASNGINRLYAQLLAAKLNIAYGADPTAIATTIAAADNFLAANNSLDWASLSRQNRNLVNSWQAALDAYNNGVLPGGPAHCIEFNPVGDIVDDGPPQAPPTDCCCKCDNRSSDYKKRYEDYKKRYNAYKKRYLIYKEKYEQCKENNHKNNGNG